jgi:hypothetical protein
MSPLKRTNSGLNSLIALETASLASWSVLLSPPAANLMCVRTMGAVLKALSPLHPPSPPQMK